MRPRPTLLGFLPALLVTPLLGAPAAAQDGWTVDWKEGTRIESEDGRFAIKLGGRIQADFGFADPDAELADAFELEDGGELRRARLFIEGDLYEQVEFKIEYDFAGGDPAAKDVYVGLVGLPAVGNLRVGHFKEPFGLEELTSSKYITFLERSFPIEAFAPSRNLGLMFHDSAAGERVTWAAGVFKDTDDSVETVGSEWNLTARLTGLPLAGENGAPLLHLGVAVSERSPSDDTARFRARPQAHLAPRLVDTGSFAADGVDLLGLESALVAGPFWAQAEWMGASVSGPNDADVSAWTVQAGWFLTGESRPYKRSSATFDRVRPAHDFLSGGGPGAWEIAVRYSALDLDDGAAATGIFGGEQDGAGIAVNWYLNPVSRVMLDWVTTDLEGSSAVTGSVDFVLLRLAIDF